MFTLARFELRRFMRARLTRAAMVVLMLVPLLYGALYLWAFWDPYGQLKRIPVAIVNEDQRAGDVNAGADLQETLIDRQVFGWKVTDAKDAARGLDDGTYHLVFTIPKDFSAALNSPADTAAAPHRGELRVVTNDATNYLSGMLARSAFTEIRAGASGKATKKYLDKMLLSFTELKKGIGEAANGAGQLNDGSGRLSAGANKLDDGLGTAHTGSTQLADGLASANSGAQRITAGLVTLNAGTGQLADGTTKLAAGNRALATKLSGAADQIEPFLREHGGDIGTAAGIVADGAELIANRLDTLPNLVTDATTQAQQVQRSVVQLCEERPELRTDATYKAALDAANRTVDAAKAVQAALNTDPGAFTALKTKLRDVATKARALQQAAPHLADDVAGARTSVNALAAASEQIATGANQIHTGVTSATGAMKELSGGLYRLSTGARQLDSGVGALSGGAGELAGGLVTLHDGAGRLATGLTDAEGRIPGYDADARAQRSDIMGDPVALQRSAKNAASTYGVGFSPYFIALALWVGAMLAYMLLRPVNSRHLASGAPAWRVALAGWLPGFAVGMVQAAVLLAVLHFALGLNLERPWAAGGLLVLTVGAFTAILQLIGAKLGAAGRVLALMLLMLQLTSSGGTYPIETSPGFLRALHPYLPMTYVVRGLRHLINGGAAGPVWQAVAVLIAFTAGALGLTTLVLRRSRRLTPSKLHPDLQM
ncbi:YhgE/Pip domain-containing protein [Longispora sp. K20-0274]|uniref:YhgE/Pip family protein n=1 Tax=Longispora sp. K20-0274 TaxID=3088255 RepID=UPI00399B5939